jgi:hypothetical protein
MIAAQSALLPYLIADALNTNRLTDTPLAGQADISHLTPTWGRRSISTETILGVGEQKNKINLTETGILTRSAWGRAVPATLVASGRHALRLLGVVLS